MNPKIAVLLPCYNEELTIEKVINDFRRELPEADIWVYDNNSTDRSVELASAAGAKIRKVTQQGKGHVVRRMFQEIDADCYVLVDSDDTYPAEDVHKLIEPILSGEADIVIGDRLSTTYDSLAKKRQFHGFGNRLLCNLIRFLFRQKVSDVTTGYRVFSRLYVKNCPVLVNGFEIETELTLHTLDKRMNFIEIPITYRDRPEGSFSKLNTFSDGFRVIKTIVILFRNYRPFLFFNMIASIFFLFSLILFLPVLFEYFQIKQVPRFPTLIVSGFSAICGLLSVACGLILDSCKKYSDQMFEIMLSQEKGRETRDREGGCHAQN